MSSEEGNVSMKEKCLSCFNARCAENNPFECESCAIITRRKNQPPTEARDKEQPEAKPEAEEVEFTLFAGELSTQENLSRLHPELVCQIVQQTWLKAKEHSSHQILDEVLEEFKDHIEKREKPLLYKREVFESIEYIINKKRG